MRRHQRRFLQASLVTALLVGACFVMPTGGSDGLRFPHEIHGESMGLTCTTCHSGALARESAGLPGPQICTPCHSPEDEAAVPPEQRIASMFDVSGRFIRPRASRPLPEDVQFSHRTHAAKRVACIDCHGAVASGRVVSPESAVTKAMCLSCHAESGRTNECSDCHREIDANWAPATHAIDWTRRHGLVVRARDEAIVNRCSMCHDQERSCEQCHAENAPRDHTNYWRLRGHGVSVQIDRIRCSACHRPDFCQTCHENTQPRSHTGSFGSPRNRHCVTCHFPLNDSGCGACHRATPSHATATMPPSGHHPAMNCRLCHGAGVRLPHPDNGTNCIACHRF